MKLDKRKVTVVKDIYIACDGQEFEDKDDCERHEFKILEKKLRFYDHNFEESTLMRCTYVKTISQTDVDTLIQICKYCDIRTEGIKDPGIYMWDEQSDSWVNITDAVSRIYGG